MKIINTISLVLGFLLLLFGADRLRNYPELIGNLNAQLPACLSTNTSEFCLGLHTQELFLGLTTTIWILLAALAIPVFTMGVTNIMRK